MIFLALTTEEKMKIVSYRPLRLNIRIYSIVVLYHS